LLKKQEVEALLRRVTESTQRRISLCVEVPSR
jgi:hypothetical protein